MPQKIKLPENLLIASPLPSGKSGYTWTFASLLGHMLRLAQQMFGARDHSYTILGIEFTAKDHPNLWHPRNGKDIIIQLTQRCLEQPQRACFQMSHEVVHLLSPTGRKQTNVLDEGLASYFSIYYMTHVIGNPNWRYNIASYDAAMTLVKVLLEIDPDAVKTLRAEQPTIPLIGEELILKHYPQVTQPVAAALAAQFER
ncbi:MAG: hypothetical protein H7175_06175 [Burkholderiales bacterium]|nr:hypothetical protein [Anaerolineae bacterium]